MLSISVLHLTKCALKFAFLLEHYPITHALRGYADVLAIKSQMDVVQQLELSDPLNVTQSYLSLLSLSLDIDLSSAPSLTAPIDVPLEYRHLLFLGNNMDLCQRTHVFDLVCALEEALPPLHPGLSVNSLPMSSWLNTEPAVVPLLGEQFFSLTLLLFVSFNSDVN